MELFQSVEQQPTVVEHSGSSVLWLGSALILVWLLGAGRIPVTSADALLAGLAAILQTIF